MAREAAVLYHEPAILTILIQSSFLLALNVVNYVLDKAVYCGLVGQVLVGMAYGTPAANILGTNFQQVVTNLGYLGLLLIVFEGGLSTDIRALRANLLLSIVIAMTGILAPIALSFMLLKMSNATILQAFAAGCALSSTSLGTTFTVLKANKLDKTRLGTALTSAAMLDDIVGLVLVQVISNLGVSGAQIEASTVVRPVFVSLAYALALPVILLTIRIVRAWKFTATIIGSKLSTRLTSIYGFSLSSTLLLLAAITTASYAGTSNLFAAYLAGLLLTSISEIHEPGPAADPPSQPVDDQQNDTVSAPCVKDGNESWELVDAAGPSESSVERPTKDNSPQPLQANSNTPQADTIATTVFSDAVRNRDTAPASAPSNGLDSKHENRGSDATDLRPSDQRLSDQAINAYEIFYDPAVNRVLKPFFFASIGFSIPITQLFHGSTVWKGFVYALLMTFAKLACGLWLIRFSSTSKSAATSSSRLRKKWQRLMSYKAQSLYPAAMLGSAMVARGEIGFLISAIAQTNGIFDGSDVYLIVTWAILLCTIVGPISVGLCTRRIDHLRSQKKPEDGTRNALGPWLN